MSTQLSDLRSAVRRYVRETTADRWTNADLNAFINEGIRFTQSEIEQVSPNYFLRTTYCTASAGSYEMALPSDIWGTRIRNVYVYDQSTVPTGQPDRVTPGQMEWIFDNMYYSGVPLCYHALEGYIVWAPMLQYNSCFRYVYSQKESTLTSDSDTLGAIRDEHTDIIALYAAVIAVESMGSNSGAYRALMERKLMQLQADLQPQDPFVIPQVAID